MRANRSKHIIPSQLDAYDIMYKAQYISSPSLEEEEIKLHSPLITFLLPSIIICMRAREYCAR